MYMYILSLMIYILLYIYILYLETSHTVVQNSKRGWFFSGHYALSRVKVEKKESVNQDTPSIIGLIVATQPSIDEV